MSGNNSHTPLGRRGYLKIVGSGAAVTLAGCTSDNGDDGTSTPTESNDDGGATVGDTPTSSDVGEVLLGANHPLTGNLAAIGQGMSSAFELAAEHVNEAGGIESLNGAELRVITGDNKGQQETGPQVEEQLIDDGASVLTGCLSSPVTMSATATAEQRGVPHVIDVSVASEILQERTLNYVYRIQPPASAMARDYVPAVQDISAEHDLSPETASIMYVDNSFGQDIRNNLRQHLPEGGYEIVEEQAVGVGQANMDTEATRLKEADADMVIVVNYSTAGTETFNAFEKIDFRPDIVSGCASGTITDPNELEQIGSYINGGLGTNYALNPNSDLTEQVLADFEDKTGNQMGSSVAMSYAVGVVVAEALELAGSDDPEEINNALKNVEVPDHPIAMGPISFQENGENVNNLAPMHQVQDLVNYVVHPEEYAGRDSIHPNP